MPLSGLRTRTGSRVVSWEMVLVESSKSPDTMAWVGQTISHDGCNPTSTRCPQKLHLAAVFVLGSMYRASYGHACIQALQPIQMSESKSTIPLERLYNAVTGQIVTQGASSQ